MTTMYEQKFNTLEVAGLVNDNPAVHLFRVDRRALSSQHVFDLEQRAIFEKCWIYIGHESEISKPGDFLTRTIIRRPLIFCRGDDGQVRVFLNSCPHRGAEVCRDTKGNAKAFRCFYHSWSFNNRGKLIGVPGEESYSGEFNKEKLGLPEIRSSSYRGLVFFTLNPEAESLESYLAGAKKYIDAVVDQGLRGMEITAGTQLYSMKANWKLLVENTVDFYHTVPVHTSYFDFLKNLGAETSGGVQGRGHDLGNGHAVVEFRAPWGKPVARWEPSWGEDERIRLEGVRADLKAAYGEERARLIAETDRNLAIFPNLLINDALSPVIRFANPISPDYTEITQWSFGAVGEPDHVRERRLHAFNTFLGPGGLATPDDIEALDGCQRGYEGHKEFSWNDYSRGYDREIRNADSELRSDDELQLRAYYRRWRDCLVQAAG